MRLLEVGDEGGARQLAVALPVDAFGRGADFDVDDDELVDGVREDVAEHVGLEDGLFQRGEVLVVGEEDGEHIVARRSHDDNFVKNGPRGRL